MPHCASKFLMKPIYTICPFLNTYRAIFSNSEVTISGNFALITKFQPAQNLSAVTYIETIHKLKVRLTQSLPGPAAHERMLARVLPLPLKVPEDARPSAVLSLLFPLNNALHVLLIKRTEDGRAHSGQISFPGGRQEPTDADLHATALREAQEEVGIMSSEVEILGQLTPLYIPVSNFQVYPFVAFAEKRPAYLLSKQEVAYTIELPFQHFLA